MILGFTGTRRGMTPRQMEKAWEWIAAGDISEGQHGDCRGADAQFHFICSHRAIPVVLWPSDRERAHCELGTHGWIVKEIKPVEDPLVRNRKMVAGIDRLLAGVRGPEVVRSGTWATVRYMRKRHLAEAIWIAWPNGEVTCDEE